MRKIIIYQVNVDSESERFFGFEHFIHTHNINVKDFQTKVFSGYTNESFIDALEILDYLGIKKIFRHEALDKNPDDLNKAVLYLLNLVYLERYNILFLVTYYNQVQELTKLIANSFKKKQKVDFRTIPGSIVLIDLDKEKIKPILHNSVLN